MTMNFSREQLVEQWTFPWQMMDVFIGGKSSVDMTEFGVRDFHDATEFVRCYGYDADSAADGRVIHAVLVEAIYIIGELLMPTEWQRGNVPPKEILQCTDVRYLLAYASDTNPSNKRLRVWACAILRVMHTIAHIDGLQRFAKLEEAQKQIIGRFKQVISHDPEGRIWLGEKDNLVELDRIDWKYYKSRQSIILKLLHKPANVAETIYDWLGVRIVTKNISDAMLVTKCLRTLYLVSYPNIHPTRSRNTLVDLSMFQVQVDALRDMLAAGSISPRDFQEMVARISPMPGRSSGENPHSGSSYRSIQLTCRHRVTYPNPILGWRDKVDRFLADIPEPAFEKPELEMLRQFSSFVRNWCQATEDQNMAIFFPFEVQILDSESMTRIENSEASHRHYKQSQIRTARRRILREVLAFRPASKK